MDPVVFILAYLVVQKSTVSKHGLWETRKVCAFRHFRLWNTSVFSTDLQQMNFACFKNLPFSCYRHRVLKFKKWGGSYCPACGYVHCIVVRHVVGNGRSCTVLPTSHFAPSRVPSRSLTV